MTEKMPYSFTPKANRVLTFASSLASCFNKGEVSTGHILVGNCYYMLKGDTEFDLFQEKELTYRNILPLVVKRRHLKGSTTFDELALAIESHKKPVPISYKSDVTQMRAIAQEACKKFNSYYVSSDFLAWSMLQVPESEGEKILRLHGITLDKLTKELEKRYL